MALKTFKAYTKSTRGTVLVERKNIWKGKSFKSLTVGTHSTGGRNNLGRITSRHKGAGHKQKYRDILANGLKFINQNKSGLYMAIASHVTLGNAKNTLIQKMNQIQQIGHYIKTGTGYRVTAPEGFVAVDRVAGAVKLVDRLEFSTANFTVAKNWVRG